MLLTFNHITLNLNALPEDARSAGSGRRARNCGEFDGLLLKLRVLGFKAFRFIRF